MRVLMICPRYPPVRCGVGDYTALLARHLADLGAEVVIVTSRRGASVAGAPREGGHRNEGGVAVWPIMGGWGWGVLPRLCSIVLTGRFDVVHVQYQNELYGRSASVAALPVALRLARPRLPVVVTVHDYGTPWPRRLRVRALAGPYGKAWFAAMLLSSARVVLTNEQDEWRFLRQRLRYPVPAWRYVTIPVGSNLPLVGDAGARGAALPPVVGEIEAGRMPPVPGSPWRRCSGRARDSGAGKTPALPATPALAVDEVRVGYFGFVNPAKGVDTLLEGFERAWRERPNLRLVLICALRREDIYQARLLERLEGAAWRDAVTVTGEREDTEAAALLAGCDMVTLPFRDGISLRRTTLMAALALGRPVISTHATAPPAALCDGREVVLVPPGDAAELGRAMLALADDPARRAALGAAGQRAAQAFTWPSIAARTLDMYHEALS